MYYYNNNWQVMADYNDSDVFQQWYAYGNYIDETLWQSTLNNNVSALKCYVHDHLYSPAALVSFNAQTIYERYEYDAYGNATIHTAAGVDGIWLTDDDVISQSSAQNNPYLFTGRTVDTLDSNDLIIQYNRNRYYNQQTARWLTHDPLGITPAGGPANLFDVLSQYRDGLSLYEYAAGNPAAKFDPYGLSGSTCNTCGSDVTEPIKTFEAWLSMHYYLPTTDRDKLCKKILNRGMWAGNGWEIDKLSSWTSQPGCQLGDCKDTVTVHGKCYNRSAVNYYMWGLMNKLCGNTFNEMRTGIVWPILWSGMFEDKSTWAAAGFFTGSPSVVPAPERYRKCLTGSPCCNWKYKGYFGSRWDGVKKTPILGLDITVPDLLDVPDTSTAFEID